MGTKIERAGNREHEATVRPMPLAVRPDDAAALLGVSRAHLYKLISSGEIRTARAGRARLVPVAAIREWLEQAAS